MGSLGNRFNVVGKKQHFFLKKFRQVVHMNKGKYRSENRASWDPLRSSAFGFECQSPSPSHLWTVVRSYISKKITSWETWVGWMNRGWVGGSAECARALILSWETALANQEIERTPWRIPVGLTKIYLNSDWVSRGQIKMDESFLVLFNSIKLETIGTYDKTLQLPLKSSTVKVEIKCS